MKPTRVILAIVICALCVAGTVTAAEKADKVTVAQQEPCCFENPRYAGTCQVTPGPEESCGDILAYLNNPNSVGKAYCGNTKIRGGWTQVDCDGSASTAVECCQQNRE
jgi:hypothetical protein